MSFIFLLYCCCGYNYFEIIPVWFLYFYLGCFRSSVFQGWFSLYWNGKKSWNVSESYLDSRHLNVSHASFETAVNHLSASWGIRFYIHFRVAVFIWLSQIFFRTQLWVLLVFFFYLLRRWGNGDVESDESVVKFTKPVKMKMPNSKVLCHPVPWRNH